MKKFVVTKNPYLIFFPFLLIYVVFVLYFPTNGNFGDESHYLKFVHNLLNGYYSPPAPYIDLVYGPGYPLVILPFVASGLPLISITLLNAILYYFSIILLFKSLQKFASYRIVLIFSLFWACYYHCYEQIYLIYTETITVFLVSLLIYTTIIAFRRENSNKTNKYIVLAGFILGYIALTKALFGYVLICMLIGSGLLWITRRNEINYRKGILIVIIALSTTSPYLLYTYNLTGKLLFWSSSGGNNLYWMSSPFQREYGDWYNFNKFNNESKKYDPLSMPGKEDSIKANHRRDYEELFKYSGIERDDYYQKLAINNIKSHPMKFLQNCLSNFGRLLFNYPNSYALQRPINLLRLPLNGIILVFSIFSIILTVINWYKINYPIRFLIFIAFLYIGGSILGSAEPRMFSVIVPVLLIWIAYIFEKAVKINGKFDDANN